VTRGDVRVPANQEFVEKTRAIGMNVLYARTPPDWKKKMDPNFLHIPNQLAISMLESYLEGVVKMRDANNGVTDITKWPFVASVKDDRNVVSSAGASIPPNEKLYFPSAEFAELWKSNPPEVAPFVAASAAGNSGELFITQPVGQPKGVIAYAHSWNEETKDEVLQNLQYLSEKGFIVVAKRITDSDTYGLAEVKDLTRNVLQKYENYPVYLAGFARAGRFAILSACGELDPRIKGVAAIAAEPDRPNADQSPKNFISKLKIPIFLAYGEQDEGSPKKIDRAKQLVDLIKRQGTQAEITVFPKVDFNLEAKWFDGLDKVASFFEQSASGKSAR
jgi:hypothetical protein